MARAKKSVTNTSPEAECQHTCRECVHAYNWWNRGFNENVNICYCQFHLEGKCFKLLSDKACKEFKPRNSDGKENK